MKLTNEEIVNTVGAFNKLMGMKWPVDTSLEIVQLVTKLQARTREMDIVKQGLLKRYGITFEKDEMGTTIKSEVEGNVLKYLTEVSELGQLGVELKVNEKKKIKLPRKVDGKLLQIEPSILLALEKFIEVK